MEERLTNNTLSQLINRLLSKLVLYLIKVIPIIIAVLYLLNAILSYMNLDTDAISAIGGLSLLPWLYLYVCSWRFKFCFWHRCLLYYCAIEEILAWVDYKVHIPISTEKFFLLDMIIAGVSLILIIYSKWKT